MKRSLALESKGETMIVELSFGLCIGSLAVISILIGLSIMSDVLFRTGGEVAELLLLPFFTVSVGFLLLGWPMAHGHGGTLRGIILMVIVVTTDIVAALGLALEIIDAVAGARSGSASSGTAYVQVASHGNASAGTGSGSCHGHAPAPAGASMADGRSSPGRRCDGTRACPDGSAGASNE